ncbi:MAG TPA: hypothetical protein VD927_09265, partial [Chryseosolibacter sp.]|nr:hypothetical protein [Chryseosolibacter sp.]
MSWRVFTRYLLLLFLMQCPALLSAQTASNDVLVPITVRYEGPKKVKHHNYRLQMLPRQDSIDVLAFNVSRLTKSLKSLRFPNAK